MIASAMPSSIDWLAPCPRCGSIGCAASPSRRQPSLGPARQRLAIVQRPAERLPDFAEHLLDARIPAGEFRRSASGSPGADHDSFISSSAGTKPT